MNPFLPVVVGAGLLPAPATPPDELVDRVDDELLDLLCQDEAWVDRAFEEIVATGWAEPPRGGTAPLAARPRRASTGAGRAPRRDGFRRSQWCPHPYRRQRSPPDAV